MSGVVKAVTGVVKAVGKVFSGVVNAIGKVASAVVNFVASPFLGLFGGMEVPSVDTGSNGATSALGTRGGTVADVNVVYGLRKIGGIITYCETGADSNKYLWVAYALCEGLVEGLREVYINDMAVDSKDVEALNSGASVLLSPGESKSKLAYVTRLQFWTGGYFADPAATGVGYEIRRETFQGAPNWEPTMNYNGVAAIFARYEFKENRSADGTDNNPFSSGKAPPDLQVVIMGKKVARLLAVPPQTVDPVTELYNYGDLAGGYTQSYSFNPAECLLDYMRNPRYGKGLTNDEIDWYSWREAARKCQSVVPYFKGNGATGMILPFNYIVGTGATLFNNVQDMLKQFRAYMPYTNGKYKLFIEDAGAADGDITSGNYFVAATFTKDDIQGDITYTGIERSSKYSVVTVTYVEPNQKWTPQTVTYPETEAERVAYKQLDGGRENKRDETFNGITNYAIARDMARLIFLKNREQDSITFTGSSKAFELEVGDIIHVESNILRFGTNKNDPNTTPWRIVSLKLNNDFTFAIACVRHVPSIYPYTRMTEQVFKSDLWIPKGQERYYSQEPRYYLGIYPPTNASRFGLTPVNWNGNYDASNNPVSINDPLIPPPVLSESKEFIDVSRVLYSVVRGQIYADITFKQPKNPMYKSTTIYYKRNVTAEKYWEKSVATDRPGAEVNITTRVGPLIKRSYIVKFVIDYVTGDSQILQGGTNYILNATDMAGSYEDPVEFFDIGIPGWVQNIGVAPNSALAQPLTVTGVPILNAGVPTNPRGMTLTVTEDIDTYGSNPYVNGITIFYKSSAATYWKTQYFPMPPGYVGGVTQPTFQITDLGIPDYPSPPSNGQLYDFAFRYEYKDGKIGKIRYRAVAVPVEKATNTYNFNAFVYSTSIVQNNNEGIITEANAPPGAVVSPLDIKIGILAKNELITSASTMSVNIQPPNNADLGKFYGVKVYYRIYVPGVLTPFKTATVVPVPHTAPLDPTDNPIYFAQGRWTVSVVGLTTAPDVYEFVLVPIVNNNGVKAEGNFAVWGKGFAGEFAGGESMTTAKALNLLTTIPDDPKPVVNVLGWKRVYTDPSINTYKSFYYELKIQMPTNTRSVRIYRRDNSSAFITPLYGAPSTSTNYYGIGRWERINIQKQTIDGVERYTTSDPTTGTVILPVDANNVLTINLRGPTGYAAFNRLWNQTTSQTKLYDPQYGSVFDGGGGYWPVCVNDNSHEFLIQLWTDITDTAPSTRALLLPSITYKQGSTNIDGLAINKPQVVNVTDYEAIAPKTIAGTFVSFKRKLSEAESPIVPVQMLITKYENISPRPNATPGVI